MSNDAPLRGFAMSGCGSKTQVHMFEYSDGSIGIGLVTERDDKPPLETWMRLKPETFSLLQMAMFKAAHCPEAWAMLQPDKDVEADIEGTRDVLPTPSESRTILIENYLYLIAEGVIYRASIDAIEWIKIDIDELPDNERRQFKIAVEAPVTADSQCPGP